MLKNTLLRAKKGFTLAETLLAVLILLLVTGIVAQGVPMAINAYHRITDAANAHVLLSTTMTELRDKLALGSDFSTSGTTLSFTGNNGRQFDLAYDDTEKGLYLSDTTGDGRSESRLLVSDAAAARNLCVTFEGVSYNNGIVSFSDLQVHRKNELTKSLADIELFEVKIVTYQKED